jgi:DNA-binding beta-propeller fold protein YncE
LNTAQAQTTNYALGTSSLFVGPGSGSNSVVLAVTPATGAWTATTNATWLNLIPAYQSGIGSTNVIFSYDANSGPTRSGTLTIASQTLTVTQAGSTYVSAGALTTLASSGLSSPVSVAVDDACNVYIDDFGNVAIYEWVPASNALTTLVSSGLNRPECVALDTAGNIYIADNGDNSIKEWTATNNTVTTLVKTGVYSPQSVAVDNAGNVYIAYIDGILECMPGSSPVTTSPIDFPKKIGSVSGVALDRAGNVYLAAYPNPLYKWAPANNTLTELRVPVQWQVAVDGAGNVYSATAAGGTFTYNGIYEWTAASNTVTQLVSSGLIDSMGVAVDGMGNVYIADAGDDAIKELPRAFVDPTPKSEGPAAGYDSLPAVLPVTENLLPPFAPASDQAWLAITGTTNGVVSFSFTANTGSNRTANITLFGQTIPVTQAANGPQPAFTGVKVLGSGVYQFGVTNVSATSFTVLTTTNLLLPVSKWTVAGTATNTAPGQFQLVVQPTTNDSQRFYAIQSQ